jgi:hypothetical protein
VKLVDLRPRLYCSSSEDSGEPALADADHLDFDCPGGCSDGDPDRPGPRRVCIPLKPGRSDGWDRNGDSLDTLTLTPSIQVHGHCNWHGFIRNGEIQNA